MDQARDVAAGVAPTAHPAVVTVEDFTQTQLLRRSKAAGGLATARKTERGGRVRCGICQRKMQGAPIRQGVYYRYLARTLAPGSVVLADHPRTANLLEDLILQPLNGRIGSLFARDQVHHTVAAFLASQEAETEGVQRDGARRRLAKAEAAVAPAPGGDRGRR